MVVNFVEFWYLALAQPVGIVIETNDPERLRQRLYAARRDAMEEDFAKISIVISPTNPNHIWLVHKRIDPEAIDGSA